MTKARDLASAPVAPSTVSATELGYLDGVSSAVQTQLNAKATYPTQTGNSGKYLTTDGSNASWGTVSSGDLVRVNKTTFSGSSAVNIDNCFSSAYDFYVIQGEFTSSTGSAYLRNQMRSGGTNATSSVYSFANYYVVYGNAGSTGIDTAANASSGVMGYLRSTDQLSANIVIQNPYLSQHTTWSNPMPDFDYSMSFQGVHKAKTSYDGISIFPSGGTITGEINIYGYKKG
jgi:hypothetical protein